MIKRATEAAVVEKALGRTIEHDAHAIEKINDAGGVFAHALDERLVGKKVSAVDGVVKMLRGGIAFAFLILGGVDAALGADGMRALDGNDREKVNGNTRLGDTNRRHQTGQTTAHNDDLRLSHFT